MMVITIIVTTVILIMPLSLASRESVVSGAGPVTYASRPGGGGVSWMISRTASTDLLPSVLPWSPARLSWT